MEQLPVLEAEWERLPASPLQPRGVAGSFSIGGTVFIVGGGTYEPDSAEVSCSVFDGLEQCGASGLTPTPVGGAAAFDVREQTWRQIAEPPDVIFDGGTDSSVEVREGVAAGRDGPVYDVGLDRWLDVPHIAGGSMVDRWWTGTALVTAACTGLDGRRGTRMGLVAASWTRGQNQWTIQPALGVNGCLPESATLVDGRLVVLSYCRSDQPCAVPVEGLVSVLATFDLARQRWSVVATDLDLDTQLIAIDGAVLAVGSRTIEQVDLTTGDTQLVTEIPAAQPARPRLAAWSSAGFAFVDRDPTTTDLWYDARHDHWYRLPLLPDEAMAPTYGPTVALVDDYLVVWGGRASPYDQSRNSGDGYALRLRADTAGSNIKLLTVAIAASALLLGLAAIGIRRSWRRADSDAMTV